MRSTVRKRWAPQKPQPKEDEISGECSLHPGKHSTQQTPDLLRHLHARGAPGAPIVHTNIKKIDAMVVVTQGREKHEMVGTEGDNDKPGAPLGAPTKACNIYK